MAGNDRIVVGVDGSASSEAALRWALRQAAETSSRVQAVACWEWPRTAAGFEGYLDVDLARPAREAAEVLVGKAVAELGIDKDLVETVVLEGYPAKVLIEAARGADLLVVGSRGHGTLGGLLLGSVGLHCASHSPCPVVIVRGATGDLGQVADAPEDPAKT